MSLTIKKIYKVNKFLTTTEKFNGIPNNKIRNKDACSDCTNNWMTQQGCDPNDYNCYDSAYTACEPEPCDR